MKLYRSLAHPGHWIVYAPGSGWVAVPNKENGWEERHPARGLDPMNLRQVPLRLGWRAGVPVESEFTEVTA